VLEILARFPDIATTFYLLCYLILHLNEALVLYSVFARAPNVSADRASLIFASYHELGKRRVFPVL